MAIRHRKSYKKLIEEASFGWLGTTIDLALVSLAAAAGLYGASFTRRSGFKVIEEAGELFSRLRSKRLQKSLRHGLYQLADRGYRDNWRVTDEGYRRLKQLVPKYRKVRPWDGSLYLIIFDIPENLSRSRDHLRNMIKRIKCGMLQKSVWVSLEDPQSQLKDIINWNELSEFVLISKIGKDGYLSKEKIGNILCRAFKLEMLNLCYKAFLEHVERQDARRPASTRGEPTRQETPMDLMLKYLSILKTDPQLPFELLPDDWLGDKAFRVYKNKVIPQLPHKSEKLTDALLML